LGVFPNNGCPYSTGCSVLREDPQHFSADFRTRFSFIQFHCFHDCRASDPCPRARPTFTKASAPGLGDPSKKVPHNRRIDQVQDLLSSRERSPRRRQCGGFPAPAFGSGVCLLAEGYGWILLPTARGRRQLTNVGAGFSQTKSADLPSNYFKLLKVVLAHEAQQLFTICPISGFANDGLSLAFAVLFPFSCLFLRVSIRSRFQRGVQNFNCVLPATTTFVFDPDFRRRLSTYTPGVLW